MRHVWIALMGTCVLLVMPTTLQCQTALGNAFTYQGRLLQSGVPVDGDFDFTFSLFDDSDPSMGTELATAGPMTITVTGGLFAAELDFGPNAFDGNARWLEIQVAPAGSGNFETLDPLQSITATPYALHAVESSVSRDADLLDGMDSSEFVLSSGDTIAGDLTVTGSVSATSFNLNGDIITSWPSGASSLWTSGPGSNIHFDTGNVGVGTDDPTEVLHVVGPTRFSGTLAGTLSEATGPSAIALGFGTTASGQDSVALGDTTTASGNNATSLGKNSIASGDTAVAMGGSTQASNDHALSTGLATLASGRRSVAMGENTTAQAFASLVLGRFNIVAGDTNRWLTSDPVLVIGNGSDDSNRSNALTILKDGRVGIGTATPSGPGPTLYVAGQARIEQLPPGALSSVCYNSTTFALSQCSSSQRYKEQIDSLSLGLDTVLQLRPVSFRWKDHQEDDLGFVAEEVEGVNPLLVTYHEERVEGVKYEQLTAVLVKALQEQQREIESLRSLVCLDHPDSDVCRQRDDRLLSPGSWIESR